jgi:hypothetical protein
VTNRRRYSTLFLFAICFSPMAYGQTKTCSAGHQAEERTMPEYIQEFFLSDAVRNEDKGEWQFTLAADSRERLETSVGMQMEYGLTDRLQFSVEIPYAIRVAQGAEANLGWTTTAVGFQYQIVRSDCPFSLSVAAQADVPNSPKGRFSYGPTILAAKTLRKMQVHATFTADLGAGSPSFQYNLASVYRIGTIWFPTLEFNGRRFDSKNAFYATPGLYRHLDHRIEIGIGVPAGLGGVASRVGIVGKINWEFGGDSE